MEVYDGAAAFLKNVELGEDELSKAIIGCIGDVDAYMLPDAKGYQSMLRHLLEEDDEYRQKVRDEILSTTVDDFRNFASSLEAIVKHAGICVVGSKEACEGAQAEFGLELTSPFAAAAGKDGALGATPSWFSWLARAAFSATPIAVSCGGNTEGTVLTFEAMLSMVIAAVCYAAHESWWEMCPLLKLSVLSCFYRIFFAYVARVGLPGVRAAML